MKHTFLLENFIKLNFLIKSFKPNLTQFVYRKLCEKHFSYRKPLEKKFDLQTFRNLVL